MNTHTANVAGGSSASSQWPLPLPRRKLRVGFGCSSLKTNAQGRWPLGGLWPDQQLVNRLRVDVVVLGEF